MDRDLKQMMAELAAAIDAVQAELATPASDPATGLAKAKVPLSSAQELKANIDRFRIFLWAYIDSWSGSVRLGSKLRDIRIDCTCDLLAALSRDFAHEGVPATPAAQRLLTEVGHISKLLPLPALPARPNP